MTDRLRLAAQALVDRKDFWRNAGTLPGEYDNLVDALAESAEERKTNGVCVCGRPFVSNNSFHYGECARTLAFRAGVEAAAKEAGRIADAAGRLRDGPYRLVEHAISVLSPPAPRVERCEHRWFRKDEYDVCLDCGAKTNPGGVPTQPPPADKGCAECGGTGWHEYGPMVDPCPSCGGTGRGGSHSP